MLDAALALLSSTAKEILSRETYQKIKKSSTFHQLNDAKRIFAQIIEENENRVDSINKKSKSCAEKGILAIQHIQKDLEEDNTREENSAAAKTYTTEDALFIESLSNSEKNKNWKVIFNKDNSKSCKWSESLESSYYLIFNRKRIKKNYAFVNKIIISKKQFNWSKKISFSS